MNLTEMRQRWEDRGETLTDKGQRVAVFFLPLGLCQPQNAKRYAGRWDVVKARKAVLGAMLIQCRRRATPLPGRPYVRCVRLSSKEPDKYSDWAKVAVDCLCSPTKRAPVRLGLIVDDAPRFAEIDQQWREASPKEGFCVIEVWEGESA